MKSFYNRETTELMLEFGTDPTKGLDTEPEVEQNREKYGENKLYEKKKKSTFQIFLEQFKDFLVFILIVAAIISFVTDNIESTIVIVTVLILNAILGTVQTVKAEQSLESLKKLSSPEAKVIRDGEQLIIPAEEVVVGDIVVLDAGDVVPADGRIFESHSIKANESALTGESEAVDKYDTVIAEEDVALGDQKNMAFSGSLITYGRGKLLVTGVGRSTELGRIADLMNDAEERKTPLQVTIDNFSKRLSVIILIICFIVMILGIKRGMPTTDALLFAVALVVAAIPEALSSIITISLAIGTSRMANENAIIKKLDAVEGLGCVSIICSDKTGTLTMNKMTVEGVLPWETMDDEMELASILCNDTAIVDGVTVGDPTETAFVDYYRNNNSDYDEVMAKYPRLQEAPFDSDRKLMSTLHKIEDKYVMFTKGALDVILARSVNLSQEQKEEIAKENFELSNNGLRVLAFAMKEFDSEVEITPEDEIDLTYLGLMAEMDPPREESAKAVEDCRKAGIKPIMITGDHKITASAIARRIGIMEEGDLAVTGPELDKMSQDELNEKLEHISVYARVSPDNKIRIVNAWQDRAHIVAMTGDGVNDGPALKSADVGVAMGITGTDVAKDSASMILTDDNFATIIKSVLNGRNIYANIKNAIKFLLSGNAAGIIAVLYTSLLALPMPFTAVQLLFINLITDSLPALSISMEPGDPRLINDKPRPRDESVLNKTTMMEIGASGLLIAIATLIAYHIGLGMGGSVEASTMAFSTLCLARLFHGFNSRGKSNIFKLKFQSNWFSVGAFVVGAILLHLLLLAPPLAHLFSVAMLDPHLLGMVWGLAALPTVLIQLYKIVRRF